MKMTELLKWFSVALLSGSAWPQNCGNAPGPYTYSEQFYKAEARLLQADRGSSADVSVAYDDLAVKGSQSSTEKISDYKTLTILQATQIVQQEHASAAANIIAECGYRACFLQNAGSGGASSLSTLTLLSQVCNPALAVPSTKSSSPGNQLSVSPGNATVVFNSSAPQDRTISVKNGTAGTMKVIWTIDPGQDSQAQGVISVIQPTVKPFSIGPNASVPVKIAIHKRRSVGPLTPNITFSAEADSTVAATTQLIVLPSALLLLPNAQVASGTLNPNARIAVDQRNENVPIKYAAHDHPVALPVDGDVQYENPAPGWGTRGQAKYQGTFKEIASQADRAAGQLTMSAHVGGTCGGAFTEAPGAYGEVTPDWSSSLNLPGFKGRQIWKVAISTDIGPLGPSASCKVVVGIKQRPVLTNTTDTFELQLAPGAYNLELSCSDPSSPLSYGCKGAPGFPHYIDQKYEIRIDANRFTVSQQR